MLIPIGKITKELGIKPFHLHKWEERGWLGTEPVLKDPENNGQRTYTENQVERIYFIHKEIERQRKEGIKRTDFDLMEEKLLEKFGGEIKEVETKEIMMLPASAEEFYNVMLQQQKEIHELKQMLNNFTSRALPEPKDHSNDLNEIKEELQSSKEREEKLFGVIENLQKEVESLKQVPQKKKSAWKFWG